MTVLLIFCTVGSLLLTDAFILKQHKIDLTEHPNWPLVYHDENCGRSKLPLARKSIGGRNVDIGKYPWMARLVYRSYRKDYEAGGCGGTLINNRYVITAAHCCLKDKDATLAFIRLGEYDIHRTKDCFKGNCAPQPLDVEAAIVVSHPLYKDKNKFDNDICFIRLFDEVKFTDYIQPICLPSSMETDEKGLYNKTMTVAGWGAIENLPKERAPHVLQEVNVVVKPTELCNSTLELDMDAMNQICATGVEPAQSPCPGDSGGPLMYYDTIGDSRRYVLMGVVSAGIPCSSSDPDTNPIVFTRMSTAMPWLLYSIHE